MAHKQVIKAQSSADGFYGSTYTAGNYLPFGFDNLYPQRLIALVSESGTATQAINLKAKFIEGNGFADPKFQKAVVSQKTGGKADALLRRIAKDLSMFEGFALHIQYNIHGLITSVSHVPFEKCRRERPDSTDGKIKQIAVVNRLDLLYQRNWGLKYSKTEFYDIFNPDPEQVQKDIIAAGGILNYKGQIYYFFHDRPGSRYYPTPVYDSVLDDIETEASIKRSKKGDTKRGFSAQVAVTLYGDSNPSVEKRNEDADRFRDFVGDNGSRILLEYAANRDSKPDYDALQAPLADKLYQYTESSSQQNIRDMFQIPTILYGKDISGKLGTSGEFQEAIEYVCKWVVNTDQRAISEAFQNIFSNYWKEESLPANMDFSIENLTFGEVVSDGDLLPEPEVDELTKVRADLQGGAGGITSLLAIQAAVANGTTQYEAAVQMVIHIFGFPEATARAIIGMPPQTIVPAQPAPAQNAKPLFGKLNLNTF